MRSGITFGGLPWTVLILLRIRRSEGYPPEGNRARLPRIVPRGEAPVTTGPGDEKAAAAARGHLRASHADREQVIGTLKVAFVQGRLIKDELDLRVGQAFAARTYADLAALTADLPAGPAPAAIGRTAAWLAKQVELALVSADLSLPQYRILGLLTEGSAVSSSLAERLAVRPPSITAVVDGLVSRSLVERRHAEDDRRQPA